jgi:multiple sugar transport system substrate-binding protein/sorbitol/mannitol transport system substrate-binding protein
MKRFHRQTLATGLAAAILVSSLAGCANPGTTASGGSEASSENAKSDVTINVMLQKHTATDVLQTKFDKFTEETGIKVKADVLPQEQIVAKTQLALSSGGSDVDVVMYDHMYTTQFAGAGWIRDLSPYIEKSKYDVDDFMAGFINALSYNGKSYALPIYGESTMLMYNKELFKKAGLEKAPANKEEFDAAVKKLTDAGIPSFVCRGDKSPGGNIYVWAGFLLGMGGSWFDQSGKLSLNTPEAVAATQYYSDLLTKHSIPGGTTLTWDQVQLAIQQNKVAMAIDATNFAPRVENPDNSTVSGKIGYAEVPEGVAIPSTACWGLAIPTGSQHPDEAWEFIKWALSSDMQLQTTIEGDRCDVTRKSTMNAPEFTKKYNYDDGNWIKTTIAAMGKSPADYRPRIADWAKLGDSVAGAVSSVVSGQNNAKAALDQVQKDCGSMTYPAYNKK